MNRQAHERQRSLQYHLPELNFNPPLLCVAAEVKAGHLAHIVLYKVLGVCRGALLKMHL